MTARKHRPRLKVVKHKRPNATTRTPELVRDFLQHVAEGKSVVSFCDERGCSRTQFYPWMKDDPELAEQFARAREIGCEVIEDEMLEIADTPTLIPVVQGDKVLLLPHPDDVAHRKLQLWMREKKLTWFRPDKYGTKVGIGGAAGLPALDAPLTDAERLVRINQLLEKAGHPQLTVTVGPAHEDNNEEESRDDSAAEAGAE